MFFEVAPDSVIGNACATGRDPRLSRWIPAVMLVWTFWIFATPLFDGGDRPWLVPTLASFPVFLWLYFRAYYRSVAEVHWSAYGIAALGFIITPVNPGGQGYVVYACAFMAFTGRTPWMSVRRMLAMLALYALECAWLGTHWVFIVSSVLVGFAIGLLNVMFRRNQQQNAELRLSHEEVRRLAAMAERERIGRDLHDLLGHTLSLVALKSELAGKLLERDPAAALQEVREVERVARDALAQVRRAVTGIRAASLAAELASARLLLESANIRLDYCGEDLALPADIENCLALVLREAATNVHRHANAHRVEVTVARDGDAVAMSVRDDGCGGVDAKGNGLCGMAERLSALGGSLLISSPPGAGTRLDVRVPLRAQGSEASASAARESAPRVPRIAQQAAH
ncbi:membrane sensor signal transduction histidine kinase [Mizugakiibacter sediminis]|uniref:Histidine kinase n=1 Tax=Mizugakiibacter sediminis TaxID=1475481 RepID=A0A0K8QQR1_9GAMM|nr:sensor histidine kinase [Mizugakiibacter sediminis]GAP67228.1 membrane sensor signal transduction histidine kinase [Mizugakiibacter sediminis]